MKPIERLLHPQLQSRSLSRQQFIKTAGHGLAVGAMGSALAACEKKPQTTAATTTGATVPKLTANSPSAEVPADSTAPIKLEQIKAKTEQQDTPTPLPENKRVGYALVGLGHLTLNQLLPAFGACSKSKVVAGAARYPTWACIA